MARPIELLAVLFFCLTSICCCGKSKPVDSIDPGHHSSPFAETQSRLVNAFLPGGFVVSKTVTGTYDDQGDSLLFTGLALAVLDCDKVPLILDGFRRMQANHRNYWVRFDPLPQEYIDRQNFVSRDGVTGALFGFAKAAKRCPQSAEEIQGIVARWLGAIGDSVFLYPGVLAGIITPSFHTLMRLARGEGVSDLDYEEYHVAALTTATLIKHNKSACYPIHLQTIQHMTIEQQGHPLLKRHKDQWCAVTKDMGLLLTDWWCGRNEAEIRAWLSKPESPHVYAHQRCKWESQDGDGKLSPRVDFLLLERLFHEGSVI